MQELKGTQDFQNSNSTKKRERNRNKEAYSHSPESESDGVNVLWPLFARLSTLGVVSLLSAKRDEGLRTIAMTISDLSY